MKKNQGMTLIGMILTMVIVITAGILALRVVTVYIQYYEVINSVQTLSALPASEFSPDPAANAEVLRSKLMNQLYVNSIESITPDQIQIVPKDDQNTYKISIQYQVVKPLIGNISLLFNFTTAEEVTISAE